MLARLLELNKQRAEREALAAAAEKPKKAKAAKPRARKQGSTGGPELYPT